MTIAQQNKYKEIKDWLKILSPWCVLAVGLMKVGMYAQQIRDDMYVWNNNAPAIARIDSAQKAQVENDKRIHANIYAEIAKLKH